MNAKTTNFLFLVCVALAYAEEGYELSFNEVSDKINEFTTDQMIIGHSNVCGENITDTRAYLEQSYKIGSAGTKDQPCTWKLRAPSHHVVHVLSLTFNLSDEISPKVSDDLKTTTVSFYDGDGETSEDKLLNRYFVTPQQKVGDFKITSHGRDMVIEIKYHDNKDFASQRIAIGYVFIDIDKAKAVLGSW